LFLSDAPLYYKERKRRSMAGRWVLGLLFGLSLALSAPCVSAQGKGAQTKISPEAKALFQEAEKSYRLGEYEKALEGYKKAYELTNRPSLLYNMAQCYRLLGDYEEAIRSYNFYLRDDPKSPKKAEVKKRITELEALVAQEEEANLGIVSPYGDRPAPTPPAVIPPTISDALEEPAPARVSRRGLLLTSGALALGSALSGGGALLLRLDNGIESELERNIGIGLAGLSDASLATAAVVASIALFRKKDVAVSIAPAPRGVLISFSEGNP
jgi:tetratricopeptide (TPR) repeat protein